MQKTKIDWADMTWNPVTGCLHECEYCYAKKIANRFGNFYGSFCLVPHKEKNVGTLGNPLFELNEKRYLHKNNAKPQYLPYPFSFKPTLHRYRLDEPKCKTKGRTIFVCSMADLFGEWVPDSWIKEVFEACEAAPQHRYLFLTKNPNRYKCDPVWYYNSSVYKPNWWFGATATGKEDMWTPLLGLAYVRNSFLSIEPLLERVNFPERAMMPKWVIIGAETGNRKDKVIPKREWIDDVVVKCREANVPVFMKNSLIPIVGEENMIREFPWEVRNGRQSKRDQAV